MQGPRRERSPTAGRARPAKPRRALPFARRRGLFRGRQIPRPDPRSHREPDRTPPTHAPGKVERTAGAPPTVWGDRRRAFRSACPLPPPPLPAEAAPGCPPRPVGGIPLRRAPAHPALAGPAHRPRSPPERAGFPPRRPSGPASGWPRSRGKGRAGASSPRPSDLPALPVRRPPSDPAGDGPTELPTERRFG